MDHFKLKFPHILHAGARPGRRGRRIRRYRAGEVRRRTRQGRSRSKQAGAKAEELAKEVGRS